MAQTKIEYVERPKTAWDGYCEFVGWLIAVAAITTALVGIAGGLGYMFSDKTPPKQTVIEQEYFPTSGNCTVTGSAITCGPSDSGADGIYITGGDSGSGTVTSNAPGH